MLRRLSVGLLASAVAIASLPLKAQKGTAEDLGDAMSFTSRMWSSPPLALKEHCRELEHQTNRALVVSSHLMCTASLLGLAVVD